VQLVAWVASLSALMKFMPLLKVLSLVSTSSRESVGANRFPF
jgi:hypothetical protein